MAEAVIHIQWEGPLQVADALKLTDEDSDYGIYQVYGPHPVYGVGTLLYIGKAQRQTFAQRIKQERWTDWEYFEGKVHIYVGRLHGESTPTDATWERQIAIAEALLIASHKPSHNSSGVGYLSKNTDKAVRDLHVFNWGDFGRLLPEVSGGRWSTKYDYIPNYDAYGRHP